MLVKGYKIDRKKCCCGCSLRTGTISLAIFQLLTVIVWLVVVIFYEKIFTKNLKVPYSATYNGIYNIIITVFTSWSIIMGYVLRSEIILRVSLIFEVILIVSILITSVALFFFQFWIATIAGIILTFLYFYFYTVIHSYIDELYQARKIMETSDTEQEIKKY